MENLGNPAMSRQTSPSNPAPSLWAVGLLCACCAFSAGSMALLVQSFPG